jgi:hypothetical protein
LNVLPEPITGKTNAAQLSNGPSKQLISPGQSIGAAIKRNLAIEGI